MVILGASSTQKYTLQNITKNLLKNILFKEILMKLRIKFLDKDKQTKLFALLVTIIFNIKKYFYNCKVINYPKKSNCLFAMWHSRQCGVYGIPERDKLHCLISRSKDGDIIATAAESLGIKTVRGSQRKGGTQASLEILDVLKAGNNVAITIDGPLGPKEVVKKGIVEIAKISGVPIIPLAWNNPTKGFIKLKTWDEFRFPLFCIKSCLLCGNPIYVDKDASEEDIEKIRKQIENDLQMLHSEINKNFYEYFNNSK